MNILFVVQLTAVFSISTAQKNENIFTDYLQTGRCKNMADNGTHTGCKACVSDNGGRVSRANKDEDIFTDYCKPGLCEYMGGDGKHSGCKDGVLHNGDFQYPPCSENATLIPLTEKEKQLILDFHNIQRNFVACGGLYKDWGIEPGCRHGLITWDKELEKTAFLHTSYCTFDHDKCRNTPKYPFSGQNLGLLTFNKAPESNSFYINIIAYLWYLEYIYTKMEWINAYHHQHKFMVGHYLTSVNERNNRIGCTLASFYSQEKNKNVVMLSCNYPTTNIGKSTIYNSCKKPASKCVTGTDAKYKFLCSSAEKYDVSGKMKHIPYDGDGTEVFDNCGREPELYHYEAEGGEGVKKAHNNTYPSKPLATERPEVQAPTTTKKPAGGTTTSTGKPGDVPGLDSPDGNPNAGGDPDYSEDEYDTYDSCSKLFCYKTQAYMCAGLVGPLLSILF